MKKRLVALVVTAVCLLVALACFIACCRETKADSDPTAYVRFMSNCTQEVVLSSGRSGVASNVAYATQTVKVGAVLHIPAGAPVLPGFDFAGWATDSAGECLWDFSQAVEGNMTLYAKWVRSTEQQKEDYVEPNLSYKEQIDSETEGLHITSVCNSFAEAGEVRLTTAAIGQLSAQAADVRQLLGYVRNPACTVTSAVYSEGKVTVTYTDGGAEHTEELTVTDITASLAVANTTYEKKAVAYETGVSIPPYSVLLAGSSSMENWSTSAADLSPLTTANVGIGGTTVEQWRDALAARLIYPYNPRAVVLYVGINNIINAGKSGAETGAALLELFDQIHLHLPEATVYYVLINYVPGYYQKYGTDIAAANRMVTDYAAAHDYMCLIDAGETLMKPNGTPNTAYFLRDGLHMSLCGYTLWGEAVKEALITHETEKYK